MITFRNGVLKGVCEWKRKGRTIEAENETAGMSKVGFMKADSAEIGKEAKRRESTCE
jgi:hypothetical protein